MIGRFEMNPSVKMSVEKQTARKERATDEVRIRHMADSVERENNRAPIIDVGRRAEVYKVLRTMNEECSRPAERDENSHVVNSVR
jgi:hypothetical protein